MSSNKPSPNQLAALARLVENYPDVGILNLAHDLTATCGLGDSARTVTALLRRGWIEPTPKMPGRHRITAEGREVLEVHGPARERKRDASILNATLARESAARWRANRRLERRRVASTHLDRVED